MKANQLDFKKIFWGSSALILIIMVALALKSGLNDDDKYQNKYAQDLYKYYTTFGKNSDALYPTEKSEQRRMKYYGGIFETSSEFVNQLLGFENYRNENYHTVRHFLNAILGFITILFTAKLAMAIGGWQMGLLALFIIFLSPIAADPPSLMLGPCVRILQPFEKYKHVTGHSRSESREEECRCRIHHSQLLSSSTTHSFE